MSVNHGRGANDEVQSKKKKTKKTGSTRAVASGEPKRKKKRQDENMAQDTVDATEGSSATGVHRDEVKVGSTVACYLTKYEDEEPQLGVVRSLTDYRTMIAWMSGDYDDVWSVIKQKNGKEWTESVPYSSILRVIVLNEDNRLCESDINMLKSDYDKF